jgi:predicted nucleotidyltransferase
MHRDVADRRDALIALCRRFGVEWLEVFGSAARCDDYEPGRSDIDFLVTFTPAARNDFSISLDFEAALEGLLGRRVDLVERPAVEASRNYIRRRRILTDAQAVYGA